MDLQKLLAQAQSAQQKLLKIQDELESKEYIGESQNGKVKVTLTGNLVVQNVEVSEELLEKEYKEMLEDLLMIAVNNALKEAVNEKNEKLQEAASDYNMPGLF